jgi:hypothetical protein
MSTEAITAEVILNDFYKESQQVTNRASAMTESELESLQAKSEKVKEFGFINAVPVEDYKSVTSALEYIKIGMPYRFITEEGIKRVCEKYGLLFGNTRRYLGDIPDKNLEDIQTFKKLYKRNLSRKNSDDLFLSMESSLLSAGSVPSIFNPFSGSRLREQMDGLATMMRMEEFMIAAPAEMMKHDPDEIKDNHILVDDPIVFKKVKGGYLIVTAWGKEAYDPEITNHHHN